MADQETVRCGTGPNDHDLFRCPMVLMNFNRRKFEVRFLRLGINVTGSKVVRPTQIRDHGPPPVHRKKYDTFLNISGKSGAYAETATRVFDINNVSFKDISCPRIVRVYFK